MRCAGVCSRPQLLLTCADCCPASFACRLCVSRWVTHTYRLTDRLTDQQWRYSAAASRCGRSSRSASFRRSPIPFVRLVARAMTWGRRGGGGGEKRDATLRKLIIFRTTHYLRSDCALPAVRTTKRDGRFWTRTTAATAWREAWWTTRAATTVPRPTRLPFKDAAARRRRPTDFSAWRSCVCSDSVRVLLM